MGINFHIKEYQCKARWSYTGFKRFRERIIKSLGLTLDKDENGFAFDQDWSKWNKDWFHFLTHSDCSGYLTSSQCGRLSKKLKKLVFKWEPNDIETSYDIEQCLALIEAMEFCKQNKKKMEFS